MTEQTIVD